MGLLKTFTFTMTVDVDIDGDVPDNEIIDSIFEKLDLGPTLVNDEDNNLYAFVEHVGLKLMEERK